MKTLINNTNDYLIAMAKRALYSLQVVIILMALPVLFMIGISKHTNKTAPEQNNKEITNDGQFSAKSMVDFSTGKM